MFGDCSEVEVRGVRGRERIVGVTLVAPAATVLDDVTPRDEALIEWPRPSRLVQA